MHARLGASREDDVGTPAADQLGALADRVRAKAASGSDVTFVPYEEVFPHGAMEEMFHRVPSIEKIGSAIGWAPTKLLDEILDDVIAYERAKVETPA